MANNSLTDITLVIDRSGSMAAIEEEAQSGINSFIRDQAKTQGRADLTLVQFDTEYEFVHRGVPIESVPEFSLEPRGCTALLDAVGRAIKEVGERLCALPEEQRPGLVVFVIVTDGHENSSREYTRQQVRAMISHQRDVYKWQFVFLGVDDAAFDEAEAMGIDRDFTGRYAPGSTGSAYDVMSRKCSAARGSVRRGERVDLEFSEDERSEMVTPSS